MCAATPTVQSRVPSGKTSHLTPGFSAAILAALFKTSIPVCADYAIIKPSAIDVTHGILGIISCVVPWARVKACDVWLAKVSKCCR